MTESFIDRIIRHEGKKLFVYDDATGKPITKGSRVIGNPTIGIGRCLNTKGITEQEALYLFNNDIEEIKQQVAKALPWTYGLDEVRRGILAEMAFQMGINGLLKFKNTLAYVKAGDWANASKNMLLSAWAEQTPERAKEMAGLMLRGK